MEHCRYAQRHRGVGEVMEHCRYACTETQRVPGSNGVLMEHCRYVISYTQFIVMKLLGN